MPMNFKLYCAICCIYVDVVLEVGLRIWLGLKNDYANLSFDKAWFDFSKSL